MPTSKVAIISATYPEIRPLVRHWKRRVRDHAGRRFIFFESDQAVAVCSGMGAEPGRRACEAVIALYSPGEVMSVGIAGALDETLHVGEVFTPRTVIDARDGSRSDIENGSGTLVSFTSVANPDQKAKLGRAYGAVAVDMEAASVARGAETHGLRFSAVKAISDEAELVLPRFDAFIAHDGHFRTAAFVAFLALRPWHWPAVLRLARNTSRAAANLCEALRSYSRQGNETQPELHTSPRGNT
jgi:adenosylhomocysteine nucleosidase